MDGTKPLNQQLDRVLSEGTQLYLQVQSVSSVVNEKFDHMFELLELVSSGKDLNRQLNRVSSELPDYQIGMQNRKSAQNRELDYLSGEHAELTALMHQTLSGSETEERDNCIRELDDAEQLVSDMEFKTNRMINAEHELDQDLRDEENKKWDQLKHQLDAQSDDMQHEFYRLQGKKNLKRKEQRDARKLLRKEMAAEIQQLKLQLEQEEAEIHHFDSMIQPANKRLAADTRRRSSSDREFGSFPESPGQRSDRSHSRDRSNGRDQSRGRRVSFADQAEHFSHRDKGQGDGRRRLHSFTLQLSDDEDM